MLNSDCLLHILTYCSYESVYAFCTLTRETSDICSTDYGKKIIWCLWEKSIDMKSDLILDTMLSTTKNINTYFNIIKQQDDEYWNQYLELQKQWFLRFLESNTQYLEPVLQYLNKEINVLDVMENMILTSDEKVSFIEEIIDIWGTPTQNVQDIGIPECYTRNIIMFLEENHSCEYFALSFKKMNKIFLRSENALIPLLLEKCCLLYQEI